MVAVVALPGRLWLNRCEDPADVVQLPLPWGVSADWPVLEGENRRYANGALRTIVAGDDYGPVLVDTWNITTGVVTDLVAFDVRKRIGVPHFARNPMGERIACVFLKVTPTWGGPAKGRDVSARLSFTLERTDWAEAV